MNSKQRILCFVHLLALQIFGNACFTKAAGQPGGNLKLFAANHPYIQYVGRINFSNAKAPRFWMPGVYIKARFTGSSCTVLLNDEMLYGSFHNYIEIAVDNNQPLRLQLTGRQNEIEAAKGLAAGEHTIVICKNTEAGIGYLEFTGLKCKDLRPLPKEPLRKIEFIGNSITCGTGSDQSVVPCGKGVWHDQHNAYMSYGPVTARQLHAQYHLSAVSGIGLMHSCCNLKIIMPQVFDKINMRNDSIAWDFKQYIPDVVTISLGQNDGIQDSAVFCNNYAGFIKQVRTQYPKAGIICLTSPMADETLAAVMKKYLAAVVKKANGAGDKQVYTFFFSKRYHNGCDGHPDLAEHQLIAAELTTYIKKLKSW
jgi:Carbohydrate esterase 2 N-terminal/GDSL-like Lipase/Acylhydrolase family